ncbi:MAG: arginine--tRNA ligase [Firmicutes bacterium]|nr:arginine--tRNA ligase [Bacillota bacterium]
MGVIERTVEELRGRLEAAWRAAVAEGELPEGGLPPFAVERPSEPGHGDFTSNLAMLLARTARKPPRAIGEALLRHLPAGAGAAPVREVEVAGPGFLNFHLEPGWIRPVVEEVLRAGERYGQAPANGIRVNIEFVSANPTGPLNVVNARAAAFGDALAAVMAAAGYGAYREFYVNDAGGQFEKLGLAMELRARQELGEAVELPEGVYPGEYVRDLARLWLQQWEAPADPELRLDLLRREDPALREAMGRFAVERIVGEQRRVLERYGVRFDRWSRESEIRARGLDGGPEWVVEELRRRGAVEEREGALWFLSDRWGDEKPRVLRRSNGELTYFVPDVAYHVDKFRRGFDRLIDIWGQDHHGYVARMRAALAALGYETERFEVLINQIVRLVRGGEVVRMSKRQGEYVTMEELLDEVGTDAARFFFLMRTINSHMDFDLDLAKLQGEANPVYYVQYAHARIASILRQGRAEGMTPPGPGEVPAERLTEPAELELMRKLGEFPEEIRLAAEERAPHRIATYVRELATLFHAFYTRCRVLDPAEPELTRARLGLVEATRIVLARGLGLLGVSAPERM